jgi:invasion protein IalB
MTDNEKHLSKKETNMSIASEIEKTRQMGEKLLALLNPTGAKLEPGWRMLIDGSWRICLCS